MLTSSSKFEFQAFVSKRLDRQYIQEEILDYMFDELHEAFQVNWNPFCRNGFIEVVKVHAGPSDRSKRKDKVARIFREEDRGQETKIVQRYGELLDCIFRLFHL